MSPNPQALIFDLDDTLYPMRHFVLSGYRAAAAHMATLVDADEDEIFDVLVRARANGERGRELQACVAHYGLPQFTARDLLDVYRNHEPVLTLPMASRAVLAALAADWRLAILTNGVPGIQARKVRALGLDRLVDAVVFACAVGTRAGKPAPEPFLETAARLDIAPDRAVMVGDDARCDIEGAARVGMKTIHLVTAADGGRTPVPHRPDTIVWSLFEVPAAAERLTAGWRSDAA